MSATTNKKKGMHRQSRAPMPAARWTEVPQKAAPGTTKRIFGYIFQYKWHVVAIVLCILIGAATSRFRAVPAIAD